MKVTIIGAGNMGGAVATGLAKAGRIPASDITVTARHQTTLDRFVPYGINTSLDNLKAVEDADVVMLVVKPWLIGEVISEIKPALSGQLIVSMAPGVKSEDLLRMLPEGARLVYVIPNTAIEILQSMTFIAPITAGSEEVEALFEGTGTTMTVDEKHLSAGTALASCGIAYAMRYVRAASEGGVELGFYAKDAVKIVCQTVMGAAGLISAHGTHPEEEIDKVTTPGGITIKGLNEMERAGFTNAVISGLKASK